MLCRDIVGHLSVEILETDRELRDCSVRFLAYREELPEQFPFGHFAVKKFEELCAHDLESGSLPYFEARVPSCGRSIKRECELGNFRGIDFGGHKAVR